jgi:hypothetical protein
MIIRWAGHMERMGLKVYRLLAGKPEEREDGVKYILGILCVCVGGGGWIGFDWLKIGTGDDLL